MAMPSDIAFETVFTFIRKEEGVGIIATNLTELPPQLLEKFTIKQQVASKGTIPVALVNTMRSLLAEGRKVVFVGNPDSLPADVRNYLDRILPLRN